MDSLDRWVAARRDRLAPGDAAWLAWSEARHAGSPEDEYRAALALFRLDSTAAAYTVLLSAVTANRMTDALRHAARRPDTTTVMGRNWAPWYNLEVWALHSLGRLDEALRLVRQARARQPDNPVHLYSEASQLAALGRLAEADTLVNVAYGFPHPFAPLQVQENIALEVLAHGRPKDAEQRFQRLLDATEALPPTLTPADSQIIRRARAELFLRVGALAEARLAYAAVGGSVALLGRGQIAAQLGDSTEVRQVVAELLADTTRWLQGRNRRAAAGILGAAGQCEPAVRLLRDALNRGARVEGAHLHEPVWAPIRECEAFQALARPR
jgi:tetratricopeptide (TPR) repeat protein